MEKRIALFQSTYDTLAAEKFFDQNNIKFRPVIKPRLISSECSMGLEFDFSSLQKVLQVCEAESLKSSGIYQYADEGWVKVS